MIRWRRLFFITLVGFIAIMALYFVEVEAYEDALDLTDEATGLLIESIEVIAQQEEVITYESSDTEAEALDGSCVAYAIRCHQDDGYFIVLTPGHTFNALLSGNPSDYASWTFYEPQTGSVVTLGKYPYEFPVKVAIVTEIVTDGHNPLVIIEFTSNGAKGKLYLMDKAGNKIEYQSIIDWLEKLK